MKLIKFGKTRHVFDADAYRDGMTVIDAGASYGEFLCEWPESLFKSTTFYCLEPSRGARRVLCERFGMCNNVKILPFALNSTGGDVTFTEFVGKNGRYHQWGNIYGRGNPKKDLERVDKYPVKGITLKELMKRIGKRVDYLKMDIEGAEYDVIDSSRGVLCDIHQLSFEYHVATPMAYRKLLGKFYDTIKVYEDEIYARH